MEPMVRIELTTFALQVRCATIAPHRHKNKESIVGSCVYQLKFKFRISDFPCFNMVCIDFPIVCIEDFLYANSNIS